VIATTWVTVLVGAAADLYEDIVDLATEAGDDARTHIPASLIEATRNVFDPAAGTPRVVRSAVCRIRPGVAISEDDRIRDDRTGRVYAINAVTPQAAIGFTPGLRLDLTLIN
jgi:hypothetical protein